MDVLQIAVWVYLAAMILAANLPWMTDRVFFFFSPPGGRKVPGWRFAEWGGLYGVALALGWALENYMTGTVHEQGWQFYAITLSLFAVSAFPGFIYRHDLRKHLIQRSRVPHAASDIPE
jgi:hypothetical protein